MRVIHLQGVQNVRDLGGIPVSEGRAVSPGLLYRSSALHSMTSDDERILSDELRLSCVMDLRCGWEREANPPVAIPQVEHVHIPFYDLEKVGIEYTEPGAKTKIVGRDVACDPLRFYRSLVNPLTVRQMRQAVDHIFSHAIARQPVLWHCSGGKDRAGILAVLVLSVLGASREDILDDYLLTNISRDKDYDRLFERFLKLADGSEERAHELVLSHRARPENLDSFYAAVDERCGGMEKFIRNQLRIDDQRRHQLRAACTTPTSL